MTEERTSTPQDLGADQKHFGFLNNLLCFLIIHGKEGAFGLGVHSTNQCRFIPKAFKHLTFHNQQQQQVDGVLSSVLPLPGSRRQCLHSSSLEAALSPLSCWRSPMTSRSGALALLHPAFVNQFFLSGKHTRSHKPAFMSLL